MRAHHVSATRYDYRGLDRQVKDGPLIVGDGCARGHAVPFGVAEPYTQEFAVLYRG